MFGHSKGHLAWKPRFKCPNIKNHPDYPLMSLYARRQGTLAVEGRAITTQRKPLCPVLVTSKSCDSLALDITRTLFLRSAAILEIFEILYTCNLYQTAETRGKYLAEARVYRQLARRQQGLE